MIQTNSGESDEITASQLLPLSDYEGFHWIEPIGSMDQLNAIGFSQEADSLALLGTLRNRVTGSTSALWWTSTSGSKDLSHMDNYVVREAIDLRGNQALLVTNSGQYLWLRDKTHPEVLKYARNNYQPQILVSETGLTAGILKISASESHLAIEDPQLGVVDHGMPEGEPTALTVVDCNEEGTVVVGHQHSSSGGNEIICSWSWTAEAGFVCYEDVPDRKKQDNRFLVQGITDGGEYLYGGSSAGQALVYDRIAQQWSQSHQGLPTGVSRDGSVAVGYQPGKGSWLWRDGVLNSIEEYLQEQGISSQSFKLQRPLGLSSDGQWLWGVMTDPETRVITSWVLRRPEYINQKNQQSESNLEEQQGDEDE